MTNVRESDVLCCLVLNNAAAWITTDWRVCSRVEWPDDRYEHESEPMDRTEAMAAFLIVTSALLRSVEPLNAPPRIIRFGGGF